MSNDAETTPESKRQARRPTIIDVAERAGVSKSLASRALRGDAGVSSVKRDRVREAATELGYRPNTAARSLVSGHSQLIGVILNDIGNQHHTEIVAGIESAARKHDTRVIIGHGNQSASELCRQMDTMIELQVDGLICVSSWIPQEALERTGALVPTVLVTHIEDAPEVIDTIASDDVSGAKLAIEHLYLQGRRNLAYATRSASASNKARASGAAQACAARGIELTCHFLDLQDTDQIKELLAGGGYDGILCNNDITAAALLREARALGISVPEELAIVGYDNTALCSLVAPTLSSVNQPQLQMGQRAVELLIERQMGRTQPIREFFDPTLVARRSSGN